MNHESAAARAFDCLEPYEMLGRRAAMVSDLRAKMALVDRCWVESFIVVPRHRFLPRCYRHHDTPGGGVRSELVEAPSQLWADLVHSDIALSTCREQAVPTPRASARTTLAPSTLARMLEALSVATGHDVLDVGGSPDGGYTTALLCHRLGDQHVQRTDSDPGALASRAHLADVGYRPFLSIATTAHSAEARTELGLTDRLIATREIDVVPPRWVRAVRPGGFLVVPVGGGIVRLQVDDERHTATGMFLPACRREPDALSDVVADPDARFWLELMVPGLSGGFAGRAGQALTITLPDGSWARRTPAARGSDRGLGEVDGTEPSVSSDLTAVGIQSGRLRQGGARKLWDEVAVALGSWRRLGQPPRDRVGLTVTPSSQRVWLDDHHHVLHEAPAHPAPERR